LKLRFRLGKSFNSDFLDMVWPHQFVLLFCLLILLFSLPVMDIAYSYCIVNSWDKYIVMLVLVFRSNLLQWFHLSKDDSGNAISNGNNQVLLALERRTSSIF
jgi:hypothetical protein